MKKQVEIQDALEEMNNGDRKSEDISETTNDDMILGFQEERKTLIVQCCSI